MSETENHSQVSNVERYKRKRAGLKSKLTIFKNYITDVESNISNDGYNIPYEEIKLRLNKAVDLLDNFDEIQTEIECQVNDLEEETSQRELFEKDYFSIITKTQSLLSKSHPSEVMHNINSENDVQSQAGPSSRPNANCNIKLPTLQLVKYSGSYEKWLEYRDSFQSIILDNSDINPIQKFHYLKSSLSGVAEKVISSLPVSSDNFSVAWKMLCERFANKDLLIYNHTKCLFSLPKITKPSASSIRQLIDELQGNLRSLKSLDQPVDTWDTLLIFIIIEKLDSYTTQEWESKKPSNATLKDLINFLKGKADVLEKIDANLGQNNKERFSSDKKSSRALVATQTSCAFCKSINHKISLCPDFNHLSISDRAENVKRLKLCFNCLHLGHNNINCKYGKCNKCGKKHHSLLHINTVNSDNLTSYSNPVQSSSNIQSDSTVHNTQTLSNYVPEYKSVLLSTVLVNVFDSAGVAHKCRALLDSASQSNYIVSNFFDKLGIAKNRLNVSVSGFGQVSSNLKYNCNLRIGSCYSSFKSSINCLITNSICDQLPGCNVDISSLRIPSNIQLSDPKFHINSSIDLLIGAGLFYNLLCVGQIKLNRVGPILQKTRLGWIVSGPIAQTASNRTICNISRLSDVNDLSRFWEIEEISTSSPRSKEEISCEEHFQSFHKRDKNGRFIVTIPFKDSLDQLGESKSIARSKFMSLERKFQKNPMFKEKYSDFMNEYLSMGHMSPCNHESLVNFYFPHHGVEKEDSLTTKLRVVFNGSSPTTSGVSLNDLQMVGPVVQNDLIAIILRFRQHSYVVSADIAKMYRQILIDPSQRNLQQIVWRSDPSQPLQTFCLNTVTYGTASASFLATRCLIQLSKEHLNEYPEASKIIANDFYVDDLLTGSDSISELILHCNQIVAILAKGCFPLRKWVSNEVLVLKGIKQIIESQDTTYTFGSNNGTKTLGLHWLQSSDSLKYTISSEVFSSVITKRTILSSIASIFDPLGLLSPVIIKAKVLMQQLWLENLSWDESVPSQIHTEWMAFRKQLLKLNDLEVPRNVKLHDSLLNELHGFCDASELAYGSCIYVRSIDAFGKVQIELLCAKSRVAPLKRVTIPRLELCSALILSRLLKKVLESLSINIHNIFLWSDSTVALSWIQTSPHLLQTFVANRVSEIQSLTSNFSWRHISTNKNPADFISRGINPSNLISCNLWWHGPEFLLKSIEEWPFTPLELKTKLETKQPKIISMVSIESFKFPFDRYSRIGRLKRSFAYCLRFIHNSSAVFKAQQMKSGALSVEELDLALSILVKFSQLESFYTEYFSLLNGKTLPSNSKLLSLNPFLDASGLLRVGGRLHQSSYSYDKKHPIIISPKHRLSKLLFEHEHLRLMHAGPQQLLYSIRETYWPIHGKALARQVVHRCFICFKARPVSNFPLMGNLPEVRVTPYLPFINTGVDYAGPFVLKDRRGRGFKTYKAYISLFICLSSKAVHLEIVTDLTSIAFIAALKRFISRRGKPQALYSDNGTTFVGANNHLLELGKFLNINNENISSSCASQGIAWHFIPAYSPHFGGIWEAGVKSMKGHLKRVLSEALLVYEDFQTILVQVESILNSRPLTPLSSDPDDFSCLTPSHFLIGRPLTSIPEKNFTEINVNRLDHFERLQQLRQHLWQRWSLEYLSELQSRQKWKENKFKLKMNDLVLLKEPHQGPMQWTLGRVTHLHTGSDGVARVASLRTSRGNIKRAVANLCLLPLAAT